MKIPSTMHGWAAPAPRASLVPLERPIPELKPHEVLLQVIACGVCHSDVHLIDDDWGVSQFPLVAGHEILGRVVARSAEAQSLALDTIVGVGWQRSACFACDPCLSARDNMCEKKVRTCVGFWGGYADFHVADSRYCFPMPTQLTEAKAAPLLCGGATVFSPLKETAQRVGPAARIGVVGLGGLGHLAVKFAAHMGFEVTVFSSTPDKKSEAEAYGARYVVDSRDPVAIAASGARLDLVLVTANRDLPWDAYLSTLRVDGALTFVGLPPSPVAFSVGAGLDRRLRLNGSPIASRWEIREMLEFADRHQLCAETELFAIKDVNEALAKVRANGVHFRAVLLF